MREFRQILTITITSSIFCFYAVKHTQAQTISNDTTWSSADTTRITENVIIDHLKTLTIEPGSVILFEGHFSILANGRILALGEEENPILFTKKDTTGLSIISEFNNTEGGWGGITINGSQDSSKFEYVHFQYGKATSPENPNGGALRIQGRSAMVLVKNCTFSYNYAKDGSAILVMQSGPRIEDCIFHHNFSHSGVINAFANASVEIIGSVFYKNGPYGIRVSSSLEQTKNVKIINCTITDNLDAGLAFFSPSLTIDPPVVKNTISWNNGQEDIIEEPVDIKYSLIDYPGFENFYEDPLFVNAENSDYRLAWDSFPLSDGDKSPCIDNGATSVPPDPDGSNADIGAFYFPQVGVEYFPKAYFEIDTVEGFNSNLAVSFTDHSYPGTGGTTDWFWDFGDGNTSFEANPIHNYLDSGIFTVTLGITNGSELHDSLTIENVITVHPGTLVGEREVFGEWNRLGSPYYVRNDIVVPDQQTLSIHPGTEVEFAKSSKMSVEGQVLAFGKRDSLIEFYPKEDVFHGWWEGIIFKGTSVGNDTSIFRNARFSEAGEQSIGALTIEDYSKIIVDSCIFFNNESHIGGSGGLIAGAGGILIISGSPIITNNDFQYNRGALKGGAIGVWNYSSPLIRGNYFKDNHTIWANAIYISYSEGTVVEDNLFQGGIGTAIHISGGGDAVVRRNVIENYSTGISILGSRPSIEANIIRYNKSGIISELSVPLIVNNLIHDNHLGRGGGIRIDNSQELNWPDPIRTRIYNNTVVNNSVDHWFAGTSTAGIYFYYSEVDARNNIVYGNTPENVGDFSNGFLERQQHHFSLIEDGFDGCCDLGNPLFVDVESNNFQLSASSPAIGAGDTLASSLDIPDIDLIGNIRIFEGSLYTFIDIGAYEFQGDKNFEPSDIYLSGNIIAHESPNYSGIGRFSVDDINAFDTHTVEFYTTLESQYDNNYFHIVNDSLLTAMDYQFYVDENRDFFNIRVIAEDQYGASVLKIFRITMEEIVLGISDLNEIELGVYPNPTEGIIYLNRYLESKYPIRIEIANSIGNIVTKYSDLRIDQIDISKLPRGAYIVRVATDKYYSSFKVFKL